jgi:hypothetical protein
MEVGMDVNSLIVGCLLFLAGGVTTALLRAQAKRFTDRARPEAKITSILIGPSTVATEAKIPIDPTLLHRERTNGVLTKLADSPTGKELQHYMEQCRQVISKHEQLQATIQSLLNDPNLLAPGIAKDQQRIQVLLRWGAFGDTSDKFAHMALGHFENEIPAKYKDTHPSEWTKTDRGMVHLSPGQTADLTQIDVEATIASLGVKENPVAAQRLRQPMVLGNILKRYWIFLEQDDLKWLLGKTHLMLSQQVADAKSILDSVKQTFVTNTPDFLRVQLMVSNDGARAIAVEPFAYLRLPKVSPIAGHDALIPLVPDSATLASPEPLIVKGNGALQISLVSEQPVANLKISDNAGETIIDGSKLRAFYETQISPSQIALSLTGFGTSGDSIVLSDVFSFGMGATARTRRNLKDKLLAQAIGNNGAALPTQ